MKKPGIIQRIALKCLAWSLGRPETSGTAAVNALLYVRQYEGRSQAPVFTHPQIEVGAHSYGLKRECFFSYHPDDRVVIGKFCSIADGVRFVFGHHRTDCVTTFPLRALCFGGAPHEDSKSKGRIEIGNDVWIGANALILSGVKIGHGAVVAAGAVVVKDVPPYAVAGGVPAQVLKHRLREDQIPALLDIAWWDWPIEKIDANQVRLHGEVDDFIRRHQK